MDARATFWPALMCCAFVGCGGDATPGTAEQPPAGESFEPLPLKLVEEAKLPKLGDYLRNIDGKVEIAPPQGWLPKGRSKEYLVALLREKTAAVPAIVVKAADSATSDFADVTADNVTDYAIAVQATLGNPTESARPMQIGQHHFARYVKDVKITNLPAEVQVLTTVRQGREYSIELRVRDVQDLKKYRDHAYAVAAGLKFAADARPFDFKPQVDPAETGPPAGAPPAETPPPANP